MKNRAKPFLIGIGALTALVVMFIAVSYLDSAVIEPNMPAIFNFIDEHVVILGIGIIIVFAPLFYLVHKLSKPERCPRCGKIM